MFLEIVLKETQNQMDVLWKSDLYKDTNWIQLN